jgi:predicted nucleic acid-binding protein
VILVDTGVWIALLRKQDSASVARLRQLLIDGDAVIAPVIAQELLQGAASQAQLERLRTHFLALPMLIPRDLATTHAAAGALYARCRWAGITPRSPHDCLIAQTAIEHDVTLLHDDSDFEFIAGVEPKLRLLRG